MPVDDTEERIAALLKRAEPLREYDHDDPRAAALPVIVEQINTLRHEQDLASRGLFGQAMAKRDAQAAKDAERLRIEAEDAARAELEDMPSRAEMEAAATRAGIAFRANISDTKLYERLKEAGALESEE